MKEVELINFTCLVIHNEHLQFSENNIIIQRTTDVLT